MTLGRACSSTLKDTRYSTRFFLFIFFYTPPPEFSPVTETDSESLEFLTNFFFVSALPMGVTVSSLINSKMTSRKINQQSNK